MYQSQSASVGLQVLFAPAIENNTYEWIWLLGTQSIYLLFWNSQRTRTSFMQQGDHLTGVVIVLKWEWVGSLGLSRRYNGIDICIIILYLFFPSTLDVIRMNHDKGIKEYTLTDHSSSVLHSFPIQQVLVDQLLLIAILLHYHIVAWVSLYPPKKN